MIYLDYAATTPMSEKSLEAYRQAARRFYGNPSSLHDPGSSARQVVEAGRSVLAGALGADGRERGVYFTGSGSEANERAVRSLLRGLPGKGHLLTTGIEHSSVRNTMKLLEEEGYRVEYLPVDPKGKVDPAEAARRITGETRLLSVHHAHSELGTVQPLVELGALAKEHGVLFHSDCVQSFGKIPVDVRAMNISAVSVSAHKVYGPKGIGAAWLDPSLHWKGSLPGVSQQEGFRHGTLDVPAIAAFAAAVRQVMRRREEDRRRQRELRGLLVKGLEALPFEVTVEGDPDEGLPCIVGLRLHGMEGQYAMLECNRKGLAISTGSACTAGSDRPLPAMTALGYGGQEAREFIRLSLGSDTGREDIAAALEILEEVVRFHLEKMRPRPRNAGR